MNHKIPFPPVPVRTDLNPHVFLFSWEPFPDFLPKRSTVIWTLQVAPCLCPDAGVWHQAGLHVPEVKATRPGRVRWLGRNRLVWFFVSHSRISSLLPTAAVCGHWFYALFLFRFLYIIGRTVGGTQKQLAGEVCVGAAWHFFFMKSKTDLHPFDLFQPSVYELVRQPDFASLSIIVEDFVKDCGATFSGELLLLSGTSRFVAVFWERMFVCQLYPAEQDFVGFLISRSCFLGLNKYPGGHGTAAWPRASALPGEFEFCVLALLMQMPHSLKLEALCCTAVVALSSCLSPSGIPLAARSGFAVFPCFVTFC